MAELSSKKLIDETVELWKTYSNNRETWAQ